LGIIGLELVTFSEQERWQGKKYYPTDGLNCYHDFR